MRRKDLDDIFSVQQERVINPDNTVHLQPGVSDREDALARVLGR